jgi:hypothetical protein
MGPGYAAHRGRRAALRPEHESDGLPIHVRRLTWLRDLAACFARALLWFPPSLGTRAQGRPGAGWHPRSRVCLEESARGGRQVGRSPGLPCAMVGTVSFALSPGSDALLPPSPPAFARCADRSAAASPPRAWRQQPGARTTRLLRPRTSSLGPPRLACARRDDHAMMPSAPCRTAHRAAHGISALQPDRAPTPSRPSHPFPRLVTIAKRPSRGRDDTVSTPKQKFCKYECFAARRLTQRWGVLPDGHHKGSGARTGHLPPSSQL